MSNDFWKKSSFSVDTANCVEVAIVHKGNDYTALVRDSRNPNGPVLVFTSAEWDAFVGGAKDGEFDL